MFINPIEQILGKLNERASLVPSDYQSRAGVEKPCHIKGFTDQSRRSW